MNNFFESQYYFYLKKIFNPFVVNILWTADAIYLAYLQYQDILRDGHFENILWLIVHVLTAVFFLFRTAAHNFSKKWLSYFAAIFSLLYYQLYQFEETSMLLDPLVGEIIIYTGLILVILSIISLGRNLSIIPTYRFIQTKYMYQVVRHPIYLSYIILDTGVMVNSFSFYNLAVFILGVTLFLARIYYEEDLLMQVKDYQGYIKKVPYRLIPFLY